MSEFREGLDTFLDDEDAMLEAAYERACIILGGLRDVARVVIRGPDDDSTLRPSTS